MPPDEARDFHRWRMKAREFRALDEPLIAEVEPGSHPAASSSSAYAELPLFEDADGDVAHAFFEEGLGADGLVELRQLRRHETPEARRRRESDEQEWRRQRRMGERSSTSHLEHWMQVRRLREERRRRAESGVNSENAEDEPEWWQQRARARNPACVEEEDRGDPVVIELDPEDVPEFPPRPPLGLPLLEDEDGDVACAFFEQLPGESTLVERLGLPRAAGCQEDDGHRPDGEPGQGSDGEPDRWCECARRRTPGQSDQADGQRLDGEPERGSDGEPERRCERARRRTPGQSDQADGQRFDGEPERGSDGEPERRCERARRRTPGQS
eukprot:CAMPEP_0175539098 /NCGR_PEP_ID=MMETSP0096-20121207/26063_1 /TAXON_ID=311494 /ORGANISM="Alexandrium monilatum, Strain CCMP3105" /LENGTH=326 /DNA_ID=CAMNT_0016841963 /DNA_START=12 /DNA_END=988 /DNA_ORIENTATION=-